MKRSLLYWFLWAVIAVMLLKEGYYYLRAPIGDDFVPVISFLHDNSKDDDAIVFEPDYIFGYATDRHKFRSLNVFKQNNREFREKLKDKSFTKVFVVSPFKKIATDYWLSSHYQAVKHFKIAGMNISVFSEQNILFKSASLFDLENAKSFVTFANKTHTSVFKDGILKYPDIDDEKNRYLRVRFSQERFKRNSDWGILLHPPQNGKHTIEFSEKQLSSHIRIWAGMPDTVISNNRSSVYFEVIVNDIQVFSKEFLNERGYFIHDIQLPDKLLLSKKNIFRFIVSTKNNHRRHFHFRYKILENSP